MQDLERQLDKWTSDRFSIVSRLKLNPGVLSGIRAKERSLGLDSSHSIATHLLA